MSGVKGRKLYRPTNSTAAQEEIDGCSLLNEARAFLNGLPYGGMAEVSRVTGVSFSTLNKIADAAYYDCSVRNVEKILRFKRSKTAALPKSGNHKSVFEEFLK